MRTVVLLLLLANLTFFGFARLDSAGVGEAVRLSQQVQPDKIRLLTPQQVAALGPSKAASLADVCVEWGPFNDSERARVLADLEPLALGALLSQKRIDASTGSRQSAVFTAIVIRDPPAPSIARLKELAAVYPSADMKIGACERTS